MRPARLPRLRLSGGGELPPVRPLLRRSRRPALLALLLMLLLLLPFGCMAMHKDARPGTLSQARLVGMRGPGCLRLAVLTDRSGSMTQYTAARDAALRQILAWAPQELRPDDQLVALDWATSAAVVLPTTEVAQFHGADLGRPPVLEAHSSDLLPAVRALAGQPASRCRTSVVVISDGMLTDGDVRTEMQQQLTAAGANSVVLLRPARSLNVPSVWKQLLPYSRSTSVDGTNADAVALTMGQLLAEQTGQRLVRRSR